MKKIIWGIAAVFCVQVGFQLAMTAERSNDDYARLTTPLQNGVTDVPATTIGPELLDPDTYRSAEYTSLSHKRIQHRVSPGYADARVGSRRSEVPAARATAFRPVVITYDRRGALTEASAFVRPQNAAAKPKADLVDKRSLIAKIVTKPYDWLKAVGSKLR